MKTIAAAFISAKRAFSPALKTNVNSHFKNKYADLGSCLDAVNEALLENGIALIQETSSDPTGVTIETVFLHESGESIRGGTLHVPAIKNDPQGFGSALTYARRYSLMTACGIATSDDDGDAARRSYDSAKKAVTASIESAIKSLKASKTDDEFKAAWRIEVAKFPQSSDEYEQLKSAGMMHRTYLAQSAMAAA